MDDGHQGLKASIQSVMPREEANGLLLKLVDQFAVLVVVSLKSDWVEKNRRLLA